MIDLSGNLIQSAVFKLSFIDYSTFVILVGSAKFTYKNMGRDLKYCLILQRWEVVNGVGAASGGWQGSGSTGGRAIVIKHPFIPKSLRKKGSYLVLVIISHFFLEFSHHP